MKVLDVNTNLFWQTTQDKPYQSVIVLSTASNKTKLNVPKTTQRFYSLIFYTLLFCLYQLQWTQSKTTATSTTPPHPPTPPPSEYNCLDCANIIRWGIYKGGLVIVHVDSQPTDWPIGLYRYRFQVLVFQQVFLCIKECMNAFGILKGLWTLQTRLTIHNYKSDKSTSLFQQMAWYNGLARQGTCHCEGFFLIMTNFLGIYKQNTLWLLQIQYTRGYIYGTLFLVTFVTNKNRNRSNFCRLYIFIIQTLF